jgi:hypothetical protein
MLERQPISKKGSIGNSHRNAEPALPHVLAEKKTM